MKFKFKEYITEAIGIETVKKAIVGKPIWDYKNELVDEFDGRYRKIIGKIEPDDTMLDVHPLYNTLEKMFVNNGYVLTKVSYVKGYVTKGKQQFKIGKILQKWGKQQNDSIFKDYVNGLLDAFRDDPLRQQNRKPYLVVVSKHPYDVLGASTDRNWTSCVNLGGGIIYDSKKEESKGMNSDRLVNSLHTPFMVSYLVDPDDVNTQGKIMIQRPLSRILIYPFVAKDKPYHEYFDYNWSIGDIYGILHQKFTNIVYSWVQELNETSSDSERFERINDVYYDSFDEELVKTYMDLDEIEEWFDQNVNKKSITIGSIEQDWEGGNYSSYYIYDLKLENFIEKEHFEHDIMMDKFFFDNFFIPAVTELLMGSYFSRIYDEGGDLDIYEIYDDTGTVHLDKIPIRGLPYKLEQEYGSEEDIFEEYGPNGLFYVMLDSLRKYSLNDVGVEQSNVDSNLSGYFEGFIKMVSEKLLENDIDPDIKNWRELDKDILEEIQEELLLEFQM